MRKKNPATQTFLSMSICYVFVGLLVFAPAASAADEAAFQAAVAKVNITPKQYIWMSGYGARNKPAEGTEHDLWAKALALRDPAGNRVLVYTTDLVGIPNHISERVASAIRDSHKLRRKDILLTCSHTHCGPVIDGNLNCMYDLPDEQWKCIKDYTKELVDNLIRIGRQALDSLAPARLAWGNGKATFAVNRRLPTAKGYVNSYNPNGPVDHSVPVLRVTAPDGTLRAVLLGYACHCTTLSYYKWCGDYAGFAQINLEEKHPGAVAMFFAGCGADANPLPRRTLELCMKYGRRLSDAAEQVLGKPMKSIEGNITTAFARVDIPYERLPTREQLEKDAKNKSHYVRGRAKHLLRQIAEKGKLDQAYSCPLQVWQLGNDLTLVAISGETCVDYSLRLKKELGPNNTWVAGYCNDVFAYVPSQRVLKEGGYEGDTSQLYYGQPAKWAPSIEERIIQTIHGLARKVKPGRQIQTALR